MDNCYPNPCQNGGVCYDEGMDYTCTCTGDWLGQRCTDSKFLCLRFRPLNLSVLILQTVRTLI